MELIFTLVVNFGEVRRAQLAKSILLTSTLVPLGSFQVCSDAKERVGCGKQREATTPIYPSNKFKSNGQIDKKSIYKFNSPSGRPTTLPYLYRKVKGFHLLLICNNSN